MRSRDNTALNDDVCVQFLNGLKRPDIAIFCREPTEEEQENALTLIPVAVAEVVGKGYEAKDLEIGPPFISLARGQGRTGIRSFRSACVAYPACQR